MQLPVSATDTELEERIIQHLAAAAAMGRARQIARREGHRNRSSGQGRPHYLVFSTNSNEPSAPASSSPSQRGEGETPAITVGGPTSPLTMGEESGHPNNPPPSVQSVQASGSRVLPANQRGASSTYRYLQFFNLILFLLNRLVSQMIYQKSKNNKSFTNALFVESVDSFVLQFFLYIYL